MWPETEIDRDRNEIVMTSIEIDRDRARLSEIARDRARVRESADDLETAEAREFEGEIGRD